MESNNKENCSCDKCDCSSCDKCDCKECSCCMSDNNNNNDFSNHYDDDSFWQKIQNYAIAAGREVIEKALTLYYCLQDPDTPTWTKPIIIGALGYFIFPIDAIPDITPVVGYSDDLGAIAMALLVVGVHIKDEHKQQAIEQLERWF